MTSIYHRPSFVAGVPVHGFELDPKLSRFIDVAVDVLTDATRKAVKWRETRKKSHCDIRGEIFFDLVDYTDGFPTEISSRVRLLRGSERFGPDHYTKHEYYGLGFVIPFGIEGCLLHVIPRFLLCDENSLVPDGKAIGQDVSKRLIANINRRLEGSLLDGIQKNIDDNEAYCYEVTTDDIVEALNENARMILLANPRRSQNPEELRKLGKAYGFESEVLSNAFVSVYEDLIEEGLIE